MKDEGIYTEKKNKELAELLPMIYLKLKSTPKMD